MPRKTYIIALIATMAVMASSCNSLKKMVAERLAEDELKMGQLQSTDKAKTRTPNTATKPKTDDDAATTANSKAAKSFEQARKGGKNAKLYAAIKPWMGVPYKYGGNTKKGVDCSAFVGAVYRDAYGLTLQRSTRDMTQDVKLIGKNQMDEGDIIFFSNNGSSISHVGIYLHDGLFVHASSSSGVMISNISEAYWSKRFYRGGRHPQKR